MFAFLEDLNYVHEFRVTASGIIVADPNSPDLEDVPWENMFSSGDDHLTPEPRSFDINQLADMLADEVDDFEVGGSYWDIRPGEGSYDHEDALAIETTDADVEEDAGEDYISDEDADTEEAEYSDLQPGSVVKMTDRNLDRGKGKKLGRPVSSRVRKLLARP